jgi:N-methylhydantoinase A
LASQSIRIGIDIGGTFTDFVVFDPATQTLRAFKRLSTPASPAQAVLAGLDSDAIPLASESRRIIHGSTVATNALLERKGAHTALITTRGFRDVLQIGRQNRPALYDLFADPPLPLVRREWRLEVDERVDPTGAVLQPLDTAQLDPLIAFLREQGVASVAVSLLFSFLHPAHEQAIAARLRTAGFFASASSEIAPEYREYERASTAVINAYVSPILDRYIAHLEDALQIAEHMQAEPSHPKSKIKNLKSADLRIMQSNGGTLRASEARRSGARCIVSGPAGGVVGALRVARLANPAQEARIISFDMGGTSTDVSLCEGAIRTTSEASVGGYPIRIPIIDIHTVGAGGGSIAALDLGGALRVGPQSAGADPGPACYGRGELPTVTDANVVLGRLPGRYFLGGQMPLDESRAWHSLESLGQSLGMSAVAAARGVVEVVNAHMERALRVISVERGHDPRDFTLVSFGGAGGLHAAELARRLGIGRVLISPLAATLSAFGMLIADVVKDYALTVMLPGDTPADGLDSRFAPLVERGQQEVVEEGIAAQDVAVERVLDMRYRGQSYELAIPFHGSYMADFHAAHERAYGYARPGAPVEIVNLRVKTIGRVEPPPLPRLPLAGADPSAALLEHRPVTFEREALTPFYRGEWLQPGNHIQGPAIIIRDDTTLLLEERDAASVDEYQNLIIQIAKPITGDMT